MTSRLERDRDQYRQLSAELAEIGFISPGTLVVRKTSCGKAGCRCQGDPPRLLGPSFQWSRLLDGKTVTRRLSPAGADLYEEWIANRKELKWNVAEMEVVSRAAGEILLRQAAKG